jgi:hypothetical protein
MLKSEIDRNKVVQSQLRELVDRYNIDYIHFNEIVGRKNILSDKKKDFIKEYISIVNGLDLKAFSVCISKDEIQRWLQADTLTQEQCYNALTWRMMFNILIYLIHKYGNNLIIEMWREIDNTTNEKRILHQVNIQGIIKKFPFAHISIYRHYIIFKKEHILFSSLSDFIAYLTIGFYPKLKNGIFTKKLIRSYYDLLKIYIRVFKDADGMRIPGLEQLLEIIRERGSSL